MYYCFGCGAGGNVFTFLMEYENYSFVEALRYLADRAGVELPEQEYSKEAKARADTKAILLEINKAAAQYFYAQLKGSQGAQALSYLKNRELGDDTIKAFGLGYANKYSNDLYKYLRSKGYQDEMIAKAGLITVDESRGLTTSSEPGHVPDHGCQQPRHRLWRPCYGRRKAQIPELAGDYDIRQEP